MRRSSQEQVRSDFGRRVGELRRGIALTQAELAERLNVTTNYVARVEGGRENLTLDSVSKLAAALGVKVVELFQAPLERAVRMGRPPTRNSTTARAGKERTQRPRKMLNEA